MKTFQDRISELFHEAKTSKHRLNQKDFAVKFGASRSQLKGWLSGAGAPSTNMLRTIAKECNVSADWLIGNTDIRISAEEVVKKLGRLPDKMDNSTSPIELSPEELIFLEQYRQVDEHQKDILQRLADMMVALRKNE